MQPFEKVRTNLGNLLKNRELSFEYRFYVQKLYSSYKSESSEKACVFVYRYCRCITGYHTERGSCETC
jgi:hypothetical protein